MQQENGDQWEWRRVRFDFKLLHHLHVRYICPALIFCIIHLDELHVYSYPNSGLNIATGWRGTRV